jgi:hypothetical protein
MEQPPEGSIDIGNGTWITKMYYNGEWVGINEWHYNDKDNLCGGWVPFTGSSIDTGSGWTVESFDPLTLSPSLLCNVCKHHGWIRNGRWESC